MSERKDATPCGWLRRDVERAQARLKEWGHSMTPLEKQIARDRGVEYWRLVIYKAISDTSTVDFYDISPEGVDNLALVAAKAVQTELE